MFHSFVLAPSFFFLSKIHITWKSIKSKVAQKEKIYNFVFWTIFKFFLHFEIWIGEWKGVKFKIWIFLKLLQILYWNFVNYKNQNCTTWQDLQFCFLAHPQILFRFWITQKGVNKVFRKSVFWINFKLDLVSTLIGD
jgi:hypothetical protein